MAEEDDDLLARARLLTKVANSMFAPQVSTVTHDITMNVTDIKSPSPTKSKSQLESPSPIKIQDNQINKLKSSPILSPNNIDNSSQNSIIRSPSLKQNNNDNNNVFKGAVFQGSSLLTTYQDIRLFCHQGSTIDIDGIICTVSNYGDYTANKISLNGDFTGKTNMDAILTFTQPKPIRKVKIAAQPVSSSAIQDAIAGLDSIEMIKNIHLPEDKKYLSKRGKVPGLTRVPTTRNSKIPSLPINYTHQTSSPTSEKPSKLSILSNNKNIKSNETIQPESPRCKSAPNKSFIPSFKKIYNVSNSEESSCQMPELARYQDKYSSNSSQTVEEQHNKTVKRVMLKLKEEKADKERIRIEEMKKVEELKSKYNARSELLKENTAKRLADRRALAHEKEEKEKLLAEEELRRKEEKQLLLTTVHAEKVKKLRRQTQKRLKQLKMQEEEEEIKRLDAINKKLQEIDKLNGRSVPTAVLMGLKVESPEKDNSVHITMSVSNASKVIDIASTYESPKRNKKKKKVQDELSVISEIPQLVAPILNYIKSNEDKEDECSIDSIGNTVKNSLRSNSHKNIHGFDDPGSPNISEISFSPQRNDVEDGGFNINKQKHRKKKQQKIPSWKLPPIQVLPYINIPAPIL